LFGSLRAPKKSSFEGKLLFAVLWSLVAAVFGIFLFIAKGDLGKICQL
jgi:hypothetical protein